MFLIPSGQDWIAFIAEADVFTFSGDKKFENTAAPLEKNGFAYCQVMKVVQCWLFYFVSVCVFTKSAHDCRSQVPAEVETHCVQTNGQTDQQTDWKDRQTVGRSDAQVKEKLDGRQVYWPV